MTPLEQANSHDIFGVGVTTPALTMQCVTSELRSPQNPMQHWHKSCGYSGVYTSDLHSSAPTASICAGMHCSGLCLYSRFRLAFKRIVSIFIGTDGSDLHWHSISLCISRFKPVLVFLRRLAPSAAICMGTQSLNPHRYSHLPFAVALVIPM